MSMTTDAPAEPGSTWRFKLGIGIFALAFALWLLIPLAAAIGVEGSRVAALTGAIFIANKVLLILCVAVMGKPGFQQLKRSVLSSFSGLITDGPVSRTRHVVGLVMFCLPLVTAMIEPYFDRLLPGVRPGYWQAQLIGDIMLIASFFVLGGDFWSKLRALFVRDARVVGTT